MSTGGPPGRQPCRNGGAPDWAPSRGGRLQCHPCCEWSRPWRGIRYLAWLVVLTLPLVQSEAPARLPPAGSAVRGLPMRPEIGRAHVCTPVTNAHLVCRLLLVKNKTQTEHTYNNTTTIQ